MLKDEVQVQLLYHEDSEFVDDCLCNVFQYPKATLTIITIMSVRYYNPNFCTNPRCKL